MEDECYASQVSCTIALPFGHSSDLYFSLASAKLVSAPETMLMATTLVTISSSFGQFNLASWIAGSYISRNAGFLIVFARLSDFFGRKNAILLTTLSKHLLPGLPRYGRLWYLLYDNGSKIVPLPKLGLATGLIRSVFVVSSIVGPLLGGAIVLRTTWRGIFLFEYVPGWQ